MCRHLNKNISFVILPNELRFGTQTLVGIKGPSFNEILDASD